MKFFHNPRCSKSRAAKDLLIEKGCEIETIEYLATPPSFDELKDIVRKLNKMPQEIIRFNEAIAKEIGIKKSDSRTSDEWIQLMVDNPKLIERPIVVNGDKATIGRPLENIEEIL